MTGCSQLGHFLVMKRYFVLTGGARACLGTEGVRRLVQCFVLGARVSLGKVWEGQ